MELTVQAPLTPDPPTGQPLSEDPAGADPSEGSPTSAAADPGPPTGRDATPGPGPDDPDAAPGWSDAVPPGGSEPPPPPGPPFPPGPGEAPPPPPPAAEHRRSLRRDLSQRAIAGVAAGIADYLDVDPVVIRIAFVVLAFLGGSGFLLYVAGWVLMPSEPSGTTVAQEWLQRQPRRRSVIALVLGSILGIIALSDLFSSGPWWPHWDGGFGFFFGLGALALAVALVAGSKHRGSPLRWLFVTAVVATAAVVAVALATVFSVAALSGVPLRGGIGDTQWRPTAPSQVAPTYRLAVGNLVVDLRDVVFPPGTVHVTATVGIGHVVVEVPPGPTLSVTAHSGLGDVQVFGQDEGGMSSTRSTISTGAVGEPGNAAHIVLDAATGVGQVQVLRGS